MGLPKAWKRSEADPEKPVVPNVKLCGPISLNGREYDWANKLRGDASRYEGTVINLNHKKKPYDSREYQERFGVIQKPRVQEDALYGDILYNPKHREAESFAWWAEHCPNAVGFSHSVDAKTKLNKATGREAIESIIRVESVDLVADPATVNGIFESVLVLAGQYNDGSLFSRSDWIGFKFKAAQRGADIKETDAGFAWAVRQGEVIGFWDGKTGHFIETSEDRRALAQK